MGSGHAEGSSSPRETPLLLRRRRHVPGPLGDEPVLVIGGYSTPTFHSAFDKPCGLAIGALGFLCFGWAVSVARRGAAYFFGGMAVGSDEENSGSGGGEGGKCLGNGGKMGENGGNRPVCRRPRGPTRLFASAGTPRRPLVRWVRLGFAGCYFGPNRR